LHKLYIHTAMAEPPPMSTEELRERATTMRQAPLVTRLLWEIHRLLKIAAQAESLRRLLKAGPTGGHCDSARGDQSRPDFQRYRRFFGEGPRDIAYRRESPRATERIAAPDSLFRHSSLEELPPHAASSKVHPKAGPSSMSWRERARLVSCRGFLISLYRKKEPV